MSKDKTTPLKNVRYAAVLPKLWEHISTVKLVALPFNKLYSFLGLQVMLKKVWFIELCFLSVWKQILDAIRVWANVLYWIWRSLRSPSSPKVIWDSVMFAYQLAPWMHYRPGYKGAAQLASNSAQGPLQKKVPVQAEKHFPFRAPPL